MSEKKFTVGCTDRGQHGRVAFPGLTLGDDGEIREETSRIGSTHLPAGDVDGTRVTKKTVVHVEGHRAANGLWRWECPRCGRNKPLTEKHLRVWMSATRGDFLDISLLPR